MAGKYLGPAFDIHGGGVDLRFPHHENEQAQSRAAGRPFATYWMHNAWITTAGEKMSKSLGNSLTIPAVLDSYRGIELRYYLVAAHYRSHVEFSFEALDEAAVGFRRVEAFLDRAADVLGEIPVEGMLCAEFVEAMDNDLGTPGAIAAILDVVREGNKLIAGGDSAALRGNAASVRAMLDVLGLDPADPAWAATSAPPPGTTSSGAPSTRSSRGCSKSGPGHARRRTGRARTRSATRSRRPASRSTTPRPAPHGPSVVEMRAKRASQPLRGGH